MQFIEADNSKLRSRVYNLAGLSFSCKELTDEIKKYFTDFQFKHVIDFRDKVAQSWPSSINDSEARADWGWSPECDNVAKLVQIVTKSIKNNYTF